jgi:hypothetical protein
MAILVALLVLPSTSLADEAADLRRAEALASQKQFGEAEAIYRQVLEYSPRSRTAALGLARVLLWEGQYREARQRFLTLGDKEGAATAAYWQGDFRTAAKEFRALGSAFARESYAAIASASRGTDRLEADWLRDDQPFRSVQIGAATSMFGDPLTRWDVSAGFAALEAPSIDRRSRLTRIEVANETGFPWQRLTASASAGVQKYPDGSTDAIGSAAVRVKASSSASFSVSLARRPILTNATGLTTHPFVSATAVSWQRYREKSWMAGAESGWLRYFDRNSGRYTHGYLLVPVTAHLFAGASAAIRDTTENRFYLEAVSGTRTATGGAFDYAYRGSYTPYWTPKDFREARAIVLVDGTIRAAAWKVQLEQGISRDTATAFGPSSGTTALPRDIFSFDFRRTAHPSRAAATVGWPFAGRYRIETTIERNTTAFYAANSIHASLVRQR